MNENTSPTRTPIDWEELWREIDWDNPEHRQRAFNRRLQERARQYASVAPVDEAAHDAGAYDVLVFGIDKERYAVLAECVRGVRSAPRITRVPGVPPFYRGVVNVRGQIITVLDLRHLLNLPATTDAQTSAELVLVHAANLDLALATDHVEDVMRLPRSAVEPNDLRYAHGVTRDRILVLDMQQLFADERLIVGGMDER